MQKTNDKGTPCERIENIIMKFLQDLCSTLILRNETRQKVCLKNSGKLSAFIFKKSKILETSDNFYEACANFNAIHFASTNDFFKNSLLLGLDKVDQAVARHSEVCGQWERKVEQNCATTQDDFTMMPFHDVEMAINSLDVQVNSIKRANQKSSVEAEASSAGLEIEFKHTMEVVILEPNKQESRKVNEHLFEYFAQIKHKQKLDFYHEAKVQLQKDIDELETKLQL